MKKIEDVLSDFKAGKLSEKEALKLISDAQTMDLGHTKIDRSQIGRASCRERVCQYV